MLDLLDRGRTSAIRKARDRHARPSQWRYAAVPDHRRPHQIRRVPAAPAPSRSAATTAYACRCKCRSMISTPSGPVWRPLETWTGFSSPRRTSSRPSPTAPPALNGPGCSTSSASSRRNPDGTWHGDMLDGIAFVKAQKDHGAQPEGARVLLIGAGGATTWSRPHKTSWSTSCCYEQMPCPLSRHIMC